MKDEIKSEVDIFLKYAHLTENQIDWLKSLMDNAYQHGKLDGMKEMRDSILKP